LSEDAEKRSRLAALARILDRADAQLARIRLGTEEIRMKLCALAVTTSLRRPSEHESWCWEYTPNYAEDPYPDCACHLEERQAEWDADNRAPGAAPLPHMRVIRIGSTPTAFGPTERGER